MTTFSDVLDTMDWETIRQGVLDKTLTDVDRALARRGTLDLEDFMALISPAAQARLEVMAERSRELTLKRFGRTAQLYIPLYLSNECTNHCVYCGFSALNDIPRKTLNREEIRQEGEFIRHWGFEHLLLLTGEDARNADVDYMVDAVKLLRPMFAQISLEVQPLAVEDYHRLIQAGVSAVYVYQETYHKEAYPQYHPKGKKAIFKWRLETPDRLGQADMRKIGLGCLLGLEDWRADVTYMAAHIRYLEQVYWRARYCVSFPRLRPHAGCFEPNHPLNDKDLAQLIWAFRIFDPDLELSLTTREAPSYRDHMLGLGVTHISAGSHTDPGGYSGKHALEQFVVNDDRSPEQVVDAVRAKGYEPVWKDWDMVLEHG
ncbi:MAG TPA: 2-iminoacetate synthase ThiH [Fibrobacteraceae bacterium]|nr:2-iminoacetate synthase ThiH [Fibrobacteraceae bacterium]